MEKREATGGPERCPHANCGCAPRDEHTPYCSLYCSNAASGESLPGEADPPGACACGHGECVEAQHSEPPRPGVKTALGRRGGD